MAAGTVAKPTEKNVGFATVVSYAPRPEFSISENVRTGVVTLLVLEGDDKPYL